MTHESTVNATKADGYQSPLGKLFARQSPKVRTKKGMTNLMLAYADNDSKRIAQLLNKWMKEGA
jgi:hypothetical protein